MVVRGKSRERRREEGAVIAHRALFIGPPPVPFPPGILNLGFREVAFLPLQDHPAKGRSHQRHEWSATESLDYWFKESTTSTNTAGD